MADVRAVVFDFGGVLITPVTEKVAVLAEHHGTSMHELLAVLLGPRESGDDHPWHRCERGEIAVAENGAVSLGMARAAGFTDTGVVTFASAPGAAAREVACDFDVPARFDIDRLDARLVHRRDDGVLLMEWNDIPIVEVRE